MACFPPAGTQALQRAYPEAPVLFRHALASHPLLQLEALAEAALRMAPGTVDRRLAFAGADASGGFPRSPEDGRNADEVIRTIATNGDWVGMCKLEQLPEYGALLSAIMDEIAPVIEQRTGACLDMQGFLFISPPGTFTPYHFDAEYNILLHIRGAKQFATFPAGPPFADAELLEAYHQDGNNVLPWHDEFASSATIHELRPGDALFVPFSMPHWVRAGSEACISLSLTWQSRWSKRNTDAHRLNHALRRRGLLARPLPAWPRSAALRSTLYRAASRAKLL